MNHKLNKNQLKNLRSKRYYYISCIYEETMSKQEAVKRFKRDINRELNRVALGTAVNQDLLK